MQDTGHILVINPGSTSTKLAIYRFDISSQSLDVLRDTTLHHSEHELRQSGQVIDQFDLRLNAVNGFLDSFEIALDLIMARSAPLYPMPGGVYEVNQTMIHDLKSARFANHASNLAALIGRAIAIKVNCPVYIADPITTDEFDPVARVSGVPGFERKSRSHALNIKASGRKLCQKLGIDFTQSRWVVCHMGGGISVAALDNGRIIDVNDALLGMGPFSPERSGALPISVILDLAYSDEFTRKELEIKLSTESGLRGYLGTSDLKEVEDLIQSNNELAIQVFDAMVYQIAKEIAAMSSVLLHKFEGVILTGGMAHSAMLCNDISKRIHPDMPIHVLAGENELEALAEAGLSVIQNKEALQEYCSP